MALYLRSGVDSQLEGEMLMARGTENAVVSGTDQLQPCETPSTAWSDEQIAQRAYFKWQGRGCPMGEDLQDWLEAQEELRQECEQCIPAPAKP